MDNFIPPYFGSTASNLTDQSYDDLILKGNLTVGGNIIGGNISGPTSGTTGTFSGAVTTGNLTTNGNISATGAVNVQNNKISVKWDGTNGVQIFDLNNNNTFLKQVGTTTGSVRTVNNILDSGGAAGNATIAGTLTLGGNLSLGTKTITTSGLVTTGKIYAPLDYTPNTNDGGGAHLRLINAAGNRELYLGYDTTADRGVIQSVWDSNSVKPLALNWNGGDTSVGNGLTFQNRATNGALSTTPNINVFSNLAIAQVYSQSGTNATAPAAATVETVLTLPGTLPAAYVSGSGLATSTIVFTGTLASNATAGGEVITFGWGSLAPVTVTVASGSNAISKTWNLAVSDVTAAFLINSLITAASTSIVISTITATVTINYNQYKPVTKITSGLSTANSTLDDGTGNMTVAGTLSVNGKSVTGTSAPYVQTTPAGNGVLVFGVNYLTTGKSLSAMTLPLASTGYGFQIVVINAAQVSVTITAAGADTIGSAAGAPATSITLGGSSTNYGAVTLVSVNSALWQVISHNGSIAY